MTQQTRSEILRLVRENVREMLDYKAVEPADVLAQRLGIPADQIVKLDANENPYGPSPRVLEALGSYEGYHRYGDAQQRRLRDALAEYAGVPAQSVVAAHGADELIDLIVRAFVEPGEAVIECPPTFGMYSFSAAIQGARVIEVPRRDDFALDLEGVRDAARDAKAVFVPSPNNPTGNLLTGRELDGLLSTGLLVVVDEAYVEFSGVGYAERIAQHENLVVLRTFSKWAALAGLRAGYGIMPPAVAETLMRVKTPFTPNIAAEVAMLASLADRERLMEGVRAIKEERERMRAQLEALEFVTTYTSEANFLLCRLDGVSARDVRDGLAERGILVRYYDNPYLHDCIRISVGRAQDTDRVIEALGELGGQRGG